MDPVHRKVLANKSSEIMKRISNPVVLSAHLKTIFTPADLEEIEWKTLQGGATTGTQTMLSLLEKRGPKAFTLFIYALLDPAISCADLADDLEQEERKLRGEAGSLVEDMPFAVSTKIEWMMYVNDHDDHDWRCLAAAMMFSVDEIRQMEEDGIQDICDLLDHPAVAGEAFIDVLIENDGLPLGFYAGVCSEVTLVPCVTGVPKYHFVIWGSLVKDIPFAVRTKIERMMNVNNHNDHNWRGLAAAMKLSVDEVRQMEEGENGKMTGLFDNMIHTKKTIKDFLYFLGHPAVQRLDVIGEIVEGCGLIKEVSVNESSELDETDPVLKRLLQFDGFFLHPAKYDPVKFLGSGEFTKVYLVIEKRTGKKMAAKMFDLGANTRDTQQLVESMETEVRALTSIKHEHIVEFFFVEHICNTGLLFLEYMEGGTLQDLVWDNGPLEEPLVVKFTRQLLSAVDFLHNAKNPIIHQDIKGSNVLLDGAQKNIKLADFGICTIMEDTRTPTGGLETKNNVASFYWTSPELLAGEGFSRNTDIWSVGCTVVEMLTTKPPLFFENLSVRQKMFQIVNHQIEPPTDCTPLAFGFLKRCLCPKVIRASAAELLSHPFLNHEQLEEVHPQGVPSEIVARGPRATEAYNRALLEGKGYVRRVPLMIIGQERTGKTSLKRSLKGELFNPNEGSTKGIETDPSYFKVSTDVWSTGKNSKDTESEPTFSFEHQAAQLIVESLLKKETNTPDAEDYSRSPSNSGTESSKVMGSVMTDQSPQYLKPDDKAKADSAKEPRTKVMEPSLQNSQDHLRVPKLPEDVATLVQRLLEINNDEDDIYSIIWDFGGQSVYYDTHPIFVTKKAIYILTCDLSHDPNQKANAPTKKGMSGKKGDTCCSKTNLDCLNVWMSSVYSLVCPNTIRQGKLSPEMLPPVFLVCTHADKPYRTDKITGDLANEIYGSLKEKVYGKLLKGLFVVDNTKSGSGDECRGVIKLREKVLSFAKELPQMKEAIPLKWLKYEKVLHLWRESHEWIPIEEARQIAKKECGIDDDVQFRTLLNFLHDQRVFIHFSESPELENMVILRPQWLIDVFKEVITVKSWQEVDENFEQLWCNLEKNGILDEKLLDHAWRDLLDNQEPTYKSSLIAIMERFNLLCPWPSDGTTKQYLVPSMLMSPPTEDVLNHLNCVRIPSLFVVFNSGRVPLGLFSRLVLLFHRFCQEEWKSEITPELFNNFAMFHIIPDRAISVVIILYSSSIEIVFHDGIDSRDLNTSRAIYLQLKCLLEDIRKESFWLKDMRYEMCICCPVCSQKDSRCRAHDVRGCECLHLLSELKLRDRPYCNKPGIRGDPIININTFEHWFALSEAQGSSTPLSQQQDVTQRDNNGEHHITPKEETASERSAPDPPEVIINQLKNRDLPERATHLDVGRLPVDILLLTVEDCEFLSCLSYLNPGFCRNFHRDLGYVYLGDMGKEERKLNVAVMNCYRGSASPGGSMIVVLNAVKALRPKSVFCVGSCRSLDCNKVKLGDVVILEKLITYGPCKIAEGGIEERGIKVPLKSGLLRVMLRACDGWQPPLKDLDAREVEIHRGAFLSGPEEVIGRKRCETLLERFPEVVAIEREGEGVYTAAHDLDIEWTVIKGISGYANGRNESNSWRTFASLMAASLTAHILSDAIPFQDMRHYRSETEERGKKHTSCNETRKKVSNSGGRRKKQRKGK